LFVAAKRKITINIAHNSTNDQKESSKIKHMYAKKSLEHLRNNTMSKQNVGQRNKVNGT